MYVCLCHAVTDRQIKQVVRDGVCSLRQVQLCLRVGTNCGKCISATREIIDAAKAEPRDQQGTRLAPHLTVVASR
ncbi:MAG: (2Fe-2S)-binding protein [Nevskiales bacterium]